MNEYHRAHEASVPVTVVSITLVYCHQCMAWLRYTSAYTQTSDSDLEPWISDEFQFGPFDDLDDVQRDTAGALRAMLSAPAAPWVQAG